MVDTLDLKSNEHYVRGGSSPPPGTKCENSSVGRARPCQGRGRGFESRFSLEKKASHFCEAFFIALFFVDEAFGMDESKRMDVDFSGEFNCVYFVSALGFAGSPVILSCPEMVYMCGF